MNTKRSGSFSITSTRNKVPPWQRPGWDGPEVESRPEHGDNDWPEGAVERVTFTAEDFPHSAFPEELPHTRYFGADGWPLCIPERIRPRLDSRCQVELHRYPWIGRPSLWDDQTYLRAFGDYDRFMRLNAQAAMIRGENPDRSFRRRRAANR
jgi:hypothetical protein